MISGKSSTRPVTHGRAMKPPLIPWLYTRTLGPRMVAVDGLRGLAICGMILVNHPAPNGHAYAPLVHAPWDGWTLADTIFPAFLFVVGVSVALSLSAADGHPRRATADLYGKILRRGLLLVFINIALVNFPYYELGNFRITGVLTRIGLCSVFASLVYLHFGVRSQAWLLVCILAVHWLLLSWLGPEAYRGFDQIVQGAHYRPDWHGGYDTGGLATTLGAFASTLCGTLAGRWLRTLREPQQEIGAILVAGFAATVAGATLGWLLPVNKIMWSSSYVVLMAGFSMMALALLRWLELIPAGRTILRPFEIAGVNALVIYLAAGMLQRLLVYTKVPSDRDEPTKLGISIYRHLFAGWNNGELASLLHSLAFLAFCYAGAVALYKARIFIRL
jgi:predicted acyltransferase